ncbi:MAG TPA: hypothetical protein VM686_32110, partial [Polyangiaceae bacterium]|nr:hypothetical protein [Polyangiaceae bacterium]
MRRSDSRRTSWLAAIVAITGCSLVYDADTLTSGRTHAELDRGGSPGSAGNGGGQVGAGTGNTTSTSGTTGDAGVGGTSVGKG